VITFCNISADENHLLQEVKKLPALITENWTETKTLCVRESEEEEEK
jgi:hypothetical protein